MASRRIFMISMSAMLIFGTVFASTGAFAGKSDIYANSSTGVAINGYDPVAYFTKNAPTVGDEKYSANWNGAIWRFSNQENKNKFEASPEKYAPQYGGYCAYAVSYGSTASTDPKAWTVVAGKLYLNYSLSVRKRWRGDKAGYIKKTDNNWPGVLQ